MEEKQVFESTDIVICTRSQPLLIHDAASIVVPGHIANIPVGWEVIAGKQWEWSSQLKWGAIVGEELFTLRPAPRRHQQHNYHRTHSHHRHFSFLHTVIRPISQHRLPSSR